MDNLRKFTFKKKKIYVQEKRIFTFKKNKIMYTFLVFILFTFASCASNRPVATTHTERIEEKVMPIPVGADTIEIELCRDTRLERPLTRKGQNPTSTASSNLCKSDERLLTKSKQRIKKELKNQSDLCNLWETTHSEGVNSVHSVRNKNSVRISSTRGINISRHETDTSTRIKLTLRPDTVFVPYTNHIRSDTIVVPDRVCQQKLNRSNMTNLFLILILIAIFIIFLKNRMTR